MVWVKVCGVKDLEVLRAVEASGADAFGIVLADSPRRVDERKARELISATELPAYLVTVDADPSVMVELAVAIGAAGVQPHGAEADRLASLASENNLAVLRPVRVEPGWSLGEIPKDQVPLLDTAKAGLHGGTGERFDKDLVGDIGRRWVMAGGLGPGNVREAIVELGPWGVDASSLRESEPGKKDPKLVEEFVQEAKRL